MGVNKVTNLRARVELLGCVCTRGEVPDKGFVVRLFSTEAMYKAYGGDVSRIEAF